MVTLPLASVLPTVWLLDASPESPVRLSYDAAIEGSKDIEVFETQELEVVFTDSDTKFSIWKPITKEGFYTVTHHVTMGREKPGVGFTVHTKNSLQVAVPESYIQIGLLSKGKNRTGEEVNGHIFTPVCPSGSSSHILMIYTVPDPAVLLKKYL